MSLFHPALFVVGIIALMFSLLMLFPVVLLPGGEHPDWQAFLAGASVTLVLGSILALYYRNSMDRLRPRQLFMITVFSWIAASLFGSLPFLFCDYGFSLTDSLFESVSGITTTGATILTGLDNMPHDILLWRSLLQWLGGIGIIGMAVAILPFLRIGGMSLFKTESSDWSDKATPRFRNLAKSLLFTYLILSVLCMVAYLAAGMEWFEALNHAMTTISTGGYSIWDTSFAHYESPVIHWVAIVFMILGSMPFVLYVRASTRLDLGPVFRDTQVRGFILFLILVWMILTIHLMSDSGLSFIAVVTPVVFNVTSIITTTGYVSQDYTNWGFIAIAIFFFLTFIGGCSGSTSGGMKIFRFQLSFLLLHEQIFKLLHPRGVFSRRYNERPVEEGIIVSAVAFSFMYFISLGFITLLLATLGLDFVTSISGAATALGNVGPGLGDIIGPVGSFKTLPDTAKWVLCGGMILGRLELLTVVVMFTTHFWRN